MLDVESVNCNTPTASVESSEINIVHIGDSHVQAGFYSEPIRKNLQNEFGNGGRGLIFPYQAAKTNGPADYSFGSLQTWKAKRNCIEKGNLPTGLAGHTIYSASELASLTFKPRDKFLIGKANEISIYHLSTLDSNYTYQIADSLGNIIGKLADSSGCPTTLGLIVHAIVFGLIVYGLMLMNSA